MRIQKVLRTIDFRKLCASFQDTLTLSTGVKKTTIPNEENVTERKIWEKSYLKALDRASAQEASAEADLAVRLWAKKWRVITQADHNLAKIIAKATETT